MANKLIEPVLNNAACEKIIRDSYEGTLVMCQDNLPYAVPINHAFVDGQFIFHGAIRGRKIDVMRSNPQVVYVISKYYGTQEARQSPKGCHGPWESIIAHGTARMVEDLDAKAAAFTAFMKYYGKEFKMTDQGREQTLAIIMDVTSMTARSEMVRGKNEYWLWLPEARTPATDAPDPSRPLIPGGWS